LRGAKPIYREPQDGDDGKEKAQGEDAEYLKSTVGVSTHNFYYSKVRSKEDIPFPGTLFKAKDGRQRENQKHYIGRHVESYKGRQLDGGLCTWSYNCLRQRLIMKVIRGKAWDQLTRIRHDLPVELDRATVDEGSSLHSAISDQENNPEDLDDSRGERQTGEY
jgi:hypothetical protein